MRLRLCATRLPVLLFAASLLVGQWLFAQHLAQVEAHAAGDHCEWCLTHAPLAGALPVAALAPPSPAAQRLPITAIAPAAAAGHRSVYASRAPPYFLVV